MRPTPKTAKDVIREQKRLARKIGHDSLLRYWQDVEQRLRDGIPFEIATRTEAIRRGFTDPARFRLKPAD